MSRIPISGIPQTYTDVQAGDTFAMDRGGTMGKITYDDLSAAFLDTLSVGTVTFSTAVASFARISTSSASRLDFQATAVADTHERTRLVRDTTAFRQQTANSGATSAVDDYVATVGASGATQHQWNIEGAEALKIGAGVATLSGNAAQIRLDDTTGTNDTHRIGYMRYNDSVLGLGVRDSTGAIVGIQAVEITADATGPTVIQTIKIEPRADNTYSLGAGSWRWTAVHAVNGTIQTSDAREKEDISLLTDAEIRLAQRLKSLIRTYRWKKDPAKKHFGVIAQEVIEAFEAEGLDWTQYGIITGGGDEPFGVNYAELHSLILGA